jgi:D-sedoheptulose 7-phosphate isomerase
MKGFLLRREPDGKLLEKIQKTGAAEAELLSANLQMGLPAIALHTQTALLSAFCNDVSAETVYAQALLALAKGTSLPTGKSLSTRTFSIS